MPDYSLGKIYKIICHKTGLIYIGYTCEPTLARRLVKHRAEYVQYLKGKKRYVTSFKIFENEVYEIVLIESCSCKSKDELHRRERFYIENNVCVNKYVPGRTAKEYYEIKKDKIKEYGETNKDKSREFREANKDKKKEYDRLRNLKDKNKTRWIEPAWKLILSNKGILPILWKLFPFHKNLLPAYFDNPHGLLNYVKKPIYSREGANITIYKLGVESTSVDGDYGEEGYIYQDLCELPNYNGNYPVIGSWIIGGKSAGIGIRESKTEITDNLSRFVPHLFN